MGRSRFSVLVFLCVSFLICGCGFRADLHGEGKVVKVYYRDFNSESLFSLSEDALISISDQKFQFEHPKDVQNIEKLISIPCAREVQANVNARLVIHFLVDGKMERTWVASRFFFYDSKYNRVCEFPGGAGENIVSSLRDIGSDGGGRLRSNP